MTGKKHWVDTLYKEMQYLYSSLTPYEKIISWNSSIKATAHEFIRFKAFSSFGFSNSWTSENLKQESFY